MSLIWKRYKVWSDAIDSAANTLNNNSYYGTRFQNDEIHTMTSFKQIDVKPEQMHGNEL